MLTSASATPFLDTMPSVSLQVFIVAFLAGTLQIYIAKADDHSALVGKWRHTKSENFEEYLAANGVNWMVRRMVSKSNPVVQIAIDGDQVKIRVFTRMMTREESFTVGIPYEQKQPDGNISLALARWEGPKLIIEYKPKVEGQGKANTVTREIVKGQLVQTFKVDDVVMKRWFNKAMSREL